MAPRFKKLTDCPENLREAIDWLIQVRHGGDKTGIQKLAKALKKLIEEVIVKSFSSFCDHLCTILDPAEQRYECCREKIQSIKALKAEVDKSGNVEADKLERLLDYVSTLKTGCETNHRVDTSTNKALDDVQYRMENLEGLRNNLSGFTSDPNPILQQLCSGLETFLGFDPNSKGYTGKGIVYSDLDRLCDGVMAFLHGVLESVKDDDVVTTYDKNLSEPKIGKLVENLKSSIGKGSAQFAEQVGSVSGWLGRYREEVTEQAGSFKSDLINIIDLIGVQMSYISSLKSSDVEKIHDLFSMYVTQIDYEMSKLREKSAGYNALDSALKSKLYVSLGKIDEGIKMLQNSGKNDKFLNAMRIVKKTLDHMPKALRRFVSDNVNTTVDTYETQIAEFNKYVETSINSLRNTFLRERLAVSKKNLQNAFDAAVLSSLNLGGLRNENVNRAIASIEKVLTSNSVDDKKALDALVNDPVEAQINKVVEEINPQGTKVILPIQSLRQTVIAPSDLFRTHETSLQQLVDKSKEDLQNALKCAEDNAANVGWLKHETVVAALTIIQGKLDSVDREITDKSKLYGLAQDPVQQQLQKIKQAINQHASVSVKNHINRLEIKVGQPQSVFASHQLELQSLAVQSQEALESAIDNAIKYVESSQGTLYKRLLEAFENISVSFKRGNTVVSQLKTLITPALENIKQGLSVKFTSSHSNIQNNVNIIDTYIDHIQNNFASEFESKSVDDKTLTAWINRITIWLVRDVLKDANSEISKADKTYQEEVEEQLHEIRRLITNFKVEAEKGTLTNFHTKLTHLVTITRAVNSNSVYEDDRIEREKYFTSLIQHINNTVEGLNTAYKNAYQSSAKQYLSNALKTIREDITTANDAYVRMVAAHIKSIGSKFDHIQPSNFEDKEQRERLATLFDADFGTLQQQVEQNSAFNDDFKARTTIFGNLQWLINNTVQNLCIAYQKAYQDSAKMYLSKAIMTIKHGVNKVEEMYEKAVTAAIKQVRIKFKDFTEKTFKDKMRESKQPEAEGQDEKLEGLLTKEFKRLHEIIKTYSAFKMDYGNRATCFYSVESTIVGVMETLIDAHDLFDECAKHAKTYLDESFKDASKKINKLGGDIKGEVRMAFERVVSEVQSLFAMERKADLESLKNLLQKEELLVEEIIEHDIASGIKGMLNVLQGDKSTEKLNSLTYSNTVKDTSEILKTYFGGILDYITQQIIESVNRFYSTQTSDHPHVSKLSDVDEKLKRILNHLQNSGHFDHIFKDNLNMLDIALKNLTPSTFTGPSNILLDIIKDAICGLNTQFNYAYVNRYSGSNPIDDWIDPQNKLTFNGRNCAKIFLTIMSMLHNDLNKLKVRCNSDWKFRRINTITNFGTFFNKRGFRVSNARDSQDGEIRNDNDKMLGLNVAFIITSKTELFHKSGSVDCDVLKKIQEHIATYYEICQVMIHPTPKVPCSVFEMLVWLSGLQYNRVYYDIMNYFTTLFNAPEQANDKNNFSKYILKAYPQVITANEVMGVLGNIISYTPAVLTTFLGYGHSGGTYACDFNTNTPGFQYPENMISLLCLLLNILYRLHHQLYFLYEQCSLTADLSGWRDCYFGKGISGSAWSCDKLKCADCGDANKCKMHLTCGVKSPLQAFLEDGLQGFLPHNLSSKDTDISCSTCPRTSHVKPCKTPMGFPDISIKASHTYTGQHIMKVLSTFCSTSEKPLSKLCNLLNCLLPSPPRTLDEMFGVFYNLLTDWTISDEHRKDALKNAVNKAYFGVTYDDFDKCADLCNSKEHNTAKHQTGDLFSLTTSVSACYGESNYCGSYLKPISLQRYSTFTERNSTLYLSWIVYLTEHFYDLFCRLRNECKNTCGKPDSNCGDVDCEDTCHELKSSTKNIIKHDERCVSIVECKYSLPTICSFGFVFNSASMCYGHNDINDTDIPRRSCADFIKQLDKVCDNGSILSQLIHETIPDFLFAIRFPFMTLTLTLWLLSLLYLLHIMVVRLDLLHIKSHLHSPSSHRIAAQSLLAAARVGKLAKLTYLQP